MVSLPRTHPLPRAHRVTVNEPHGPLSEQPLFDTTRTIQDGGTLTRPLSELAGPQPGRLHVTQKHRELGLSDLPGGRRETQLLRVARGDRRQMPQAREHDRLNVLVQQSGGDSGRGGTRPVAVLPVAAVHDDLRCASRERVPASGAASDPRQQRGVLSDARGPRHSRGLRGTPHVLGHDRGVRGRIELAADAQLPEVHAVCQQEPGPGWRHLQVAGDRAHWGPGDPVMERCADPVGVLVGGELAGVRVARVSERGLPVLPHPCGGRPRPQVREPFGVLLAFVLGHPEQQGALQPAGWGGGVDVLSDDDDFAACGLDAVPCFELLSNVAAQPGQVGHDDRVVSACFDAFDGGEQGGALVEWESAADVEFGGQDVDGGAVLCGVSFDVCDLVAVGVHGGGAGSPAAHAADSYDARPVHGGSLRDMGLLVVVSLRVADSRICGDGA